MKNVIDQSRVHWPIKCSTTRSMIKHFKMFKFMQYQYRLNEHTSKQDVLRFFCILYVLWFCINKLCDDVGLHVLLTRLEENLSREKDRKIVDIFKKDGWLW
jgi:retron-type reverse transcriptase